MIPFVKIELSQTEKDAVMEVLNSGMLAQGKKTAQFEEDFARYCQTKHAIATTSGTSALHTALYALSIQPGDEVITTPFTFVATANAALMQGAKPVFADIKPDTFNIDPESIKEKISEKTKAIIPVDLFGQIYDTTQIREIADQHGLKILEDAAQSIGAEFQGKRSGTFGDCAAFSFYATKNIITGEGGMITTNSDEYMELARRFRHHGQSEKTRYQYYDLGYNYRMTDMQAAIGIEQLRKADQINEKRMQNAKMLSQGLAQIDGIEIPCVKEGFTHVFHQYTIKVAPQKRDAIMAKLKENGVGCGVYYPKPLHLHPHFERMGYKQGDFPVAEKISKQVIALPVHPALEKTQIQQIIEKLAEAMKI